MASGSEPRQLPSGRPERYEHEDLEVSSPPHQYTMLKAFDASHIFSKNPRKYDRLIAQEEGYSVDDCSYSDTEIASVKSDMGQPTYNRTRSNSLTSLDVIDIQKSISTSISPELDNSQSVVTSSNRADHMYRRCSLDHMSDYYTRRSSDAAVSAIWEPSNQPQWQSSIKQADTSAVAFYKPEEKKASGAFGEHPLADIMMKAAFKDPLILPRKDEEENEKVRENRALTIPLTTEQSKLPEEGRPRRTSLPGTALENPIAGSTKMTTVQPEPRRLFGIGPKYHPLPETVVEGVVSKGGPLVNLVKKEGLGAGTEESATKMTGKRTAPTKAEMNAWAPFSM